MKRIIATLTGDHTGFSEEFDCTDAVLAMTPTQRAELRDNDYSSDDLAPSAIIERARQAFRTEWGRDTRKLKFGFLVEIESAIEDFENEENK